MRTTCGRSSRRTTYPSATPSRCAACATPARSIFGKTNTPMLRRRLADLQSDLRRHEQPVGHQRAPPADRRAARRRRSPRASRPRARQRHRRLDPHAVELVRRLRAQADASASSRSAGTSPARPARSPTADLGVMGPIARCVDDLELALDVLAGPAGPEAPAGGSRCRRRGATRCATAHRRLARRRGISRRSEVRACSRRRRRAAQGRRTGRPDRARPSSSPRTSALPAAALSDPARQHGAGEFRRLRRDGRALPPRTTRALARGARVRDPAPPRLAVRQRAPRIRCAR